MIKVVIIDNYDSFTHNLVQLIEAIPGTKIHILKNDQIDWETVDSADKIILSPGPGVPSEAGQMPELIRKYHPYKSILGVCLGMQAIAEVFGGRLINSGTVYHGIATELRDVKLKTTLYRDVEQPLFAGRYHSWLVSRENFPKVLEITSVDQNGAIMSLSHKNYDLHGVQYHPESILTPMGNRIMQNFIDG